MTKTLPHLSIIEGKCHWPGCEKLATEIAQGEFGKLGLYCTAHGHKIVETYEPEYHACCPNCGCHFGVN